jgi:large subunit ribosomal protein L21
MFAVIQTGGKQYRVAQNDILAVERLAGEPGDRVEFDRVLMVAGDGDIAVGAAATEGARVAAEILEHARGDKVLILKKKRRKHHRRRAGHRQDQTVVRITEILAAGAASGATRED